MTDFAPFSKAVHTRHIELSNGELFVSNIAGDVLFEKYLASFPEGTNPIFRERTEYDCSCCKNFIRNIGVVVAIKNGSIQTVWDDLGHLEYPFNVVAETLSAFIKAGGISGVYRTDQASYGAIFTSEPLDGGKSRRWNHFHGTVDPKHFQKTTKINGDSVSAASVAGKLNTDAAVFKRALNEITDDALQTVVGLIEANALYRGAEFKAGVFSFAGLKANYNQASKDKKETFHWEHSQTAGARIRNTAMGTLLVDLSGRPAYPAKGDEPARSEIPPMDLEDAVKAYESMVAPQNYKRSTALITPAMITKAVEKLKALGLESAISRRFANLGDVNITNVIWADGDAKQLMNKNDLASTLLASPLVKKTPKTATGNDISIDDFMSSVVPKAVSMDVLFKNSHVNNLMSITTAVDPEAGNLFKWGNPFAWSYHGNITDSNIKDRVKAAGGNTNAKLRVSLAWFNRDDLDLHCEGPEGHIYFGAKKGILDVDMNAYGPSSDTEPVENLSWVNPTDGRYRIVVHQYNKRTSDRPGFVLEVENAGSVSQYNHPKGISTGAQIQSLSFTVKDGVITKLTVGDGLDGHAIQQDAWGLKTEDFVKVNTLMFSPNYWDGEATGNKHWFFILDGAKNDEPTRGIYNEYLKPELNEHRKVFEVLGAQTMCPVVEDQLSGLGFSSTKKDVVIVKVKKTDGSQQTYNVKF